MTLSALLSAGTVYLLYAMAGFPFAIWSGRAAYAATASGQRPGRAMTVFFVVLPLALIAWYLWASAGTPMAAAEGSFDPMAEEPDDWVQIVFFLLPPSLGLIAGYGFGWLLALRRR